MSDYPHLPQILAAYDREADQLAGAYAAAKGQRSDPWYLEALPPPPCDVLDVGAGHGLDAVWLTGRGYRVVAVEPSKGMREVGQRHPATVGVTWIDDALPELASVRAVGRPFDFVLCNGVLQHLPPALQRQGIETLVGLVRPGGAIAISLRVGPAPANRPMFPIDVAAIRDFVTAAGGTVDRAFAAPDPMGRAEVSWTMLIIRRKATP